MNLFLCICVLFAVGSMIGWLIELLFRRFFSSKKWINPGFLNGPYLPLYGFGLVGLFLISYLLKFDEWFGISKTWNAVIIIVIMTIAMTVIEYIAGLIFIKGMGIKLWDYSKRWGNIQGIICPLFTLFWGIIGAVFHLFIEGLCENLLVWFNDNAAINVWFPFVLGMFYGVFAVDLGISLHLSTKIKEFAKEHNVVVKYEEFKEHIRDSQEKAKQRISFLLPFKSETSVKENLTNYFEDMKKKINEIADKVKKN